MMNRSGMVNIIRTRIRTDPFKNNYDLVGKELGRGKFAVVKKCVEKTTGKEHAAKFLRKRRKGQDCRGDIVHEIAVLESAEANPYVVALHEVYETPSEIILVLECAAGGEIFNQCVADNDEAFTEKDVIRLARQILTGLGCLHRNNVVHLDLKNTKEDILKNVDNGNHSLALVLCPYNRSLWQPVTNFLQNIFFCVLQKKVIQPQNILLTSAQPLGDIRIVDFGLSRRVDSTTEVREILGTPEYVAPEILNYEPISTATDMWSIGVLTYVMLTGESPFQGEEKQETFLNISQVNVDYSQDVFEGISDLAVEFIRSLLLKNPRKRATAEQCLNHPWLISEIHHTVDAPLDEQEASQSESEPESPVLSPELMPSYLTCPGQGELKTGRGTFSFSEQFPSRTEIQQELIC